MGLFDTAQNISNIQLKSILAPINTDMLFVFGDKSLWFIEETKLKDDLVSMNSVRKSNLSVVYLYYEDIHAVVEGFEENYDKILVNTNEGKSIPDQLGDIFREYLPNNSTLNIKVSPLFVSLNNNMSEYFTNIYNGYRLRHEVGQKGFEVPPENIGYLYTEFHSDDYNINNSDLIVHWFYPLVMIDNK